MKRFYSVRELAQESGYSPGTIQARIGEGRIFAVQGRERGAFRIPAAAYEAYLAEIGLRPKPQVRLLAPTAFQEMTANELYRREIAPVLERAGFEDVPALLRAAESDAAVYLRYEEVIHVYQTFLARKAAELPEPALV
jgi:hypothetical protein